MQSPARIALNKMYPASIYAAPAIAPLMVGVNYATGLAQKQNQAMFNYTLQQMAMSPFSVNSEAYMERIRSAFGYADNGMYETMGTIGGVVGAGVGAYLGAGGWRGLDESLGWNPLKWKERWNNPFQSPFIRNADGTITPRPTKRELTSKAFRSNKSVNDFITINETAVNAYNNALKDLKTAEQAVLDYAGKDLNKYIEYENLLKTSKKSSREAIELRKKLNITASQYSEYERLRKTADKATNRLNLNTDLLLKSASNSTDEVITSVTDAVKSSKAVTKVGTAAIGIAGTAMDTVSAAGNIVGAVQAFKDADILQGVLYTSGAVGDVVSIVGDVISMIGNAVPILKLAEILNWVGTAQSAISSGIIGWLTGQTVGHSLAPEGAKAQQLFANNLYASVTTRPISTLGTVLTTIGVPAALSIWSKGFAQPKNGFQTFINSTTAVPRFFTQDAFGNYARSALTMMAVSGVQPMLSKLDESTPWFPENPEDVNFVSAFSLWGDINDNLFGATANKAMLIGLGKGDASAQTKALARAWGYSDEPYYSPMFDDVRQAFNIDLGNLGNSIISTIGEVLIDPQNRSEVAQTMMMDRTADLIAKHITKELKYYNATIVSGNTNIPLAIKRILFEFDGDNIKVVDGKLVTTPLGRLVQRNDTTSITRYVKSWVENNTKGIKETQYLTTMSSIKGSKNKISLGTFSESFADNFNMYLSDSINGKYTYTSKELSDLQKTLEQYKNATQEQKETEAYKKAMDTFELMYKYYNKNTKGEMDFEVLKTFIQDLELTLDTKHIKNLYYDNMQFKQYMDLISQVGDVVNKVANPVQTAISSVRKWWRNISEQFRANIDPKVAARTIVKLKELEDNLDKVYTEDEVNKAQERAELYNSRIHALTSRKPTGVVDEEILKMTNDIVEQSTDMFKDTRTALEEAIQGMDECLKDIEQYDEEQRARVYTVYDKNDKAIVTIDKSNVKKIKTYIDDFETKADGTKLTEDEIKEKLKNVSKDEAKKYEASLQDYYMYNMSTELKEAYVSIQAKASTALLLIDNLSLIAQEKLIELVSDLATIRMYTNRTNKMEVEDIKAKYNKVREDLRGELEKLKKQRDDIMLKETKTPEELKQLEKIRSEISSVQKRIKAINKWNNIDYGRRSTQLASLEAEYARYEALQKKRNKIIKEEKAKVNKKYSKYSKQKKELAAKIKTIQKAPETIKNREEQISTNKLTITQCNDEIKVLRQQKETTQQNIYNLKAQIGYKPEEKIDESKLTEKQKPIYEQIKINHNTLSTTIAEIKRNESKQTHAEELISKYEKEVNDLKQLQNDKHKIISDYKDANAFLELYAPDKTFNEKLKQLKAKIDTLKDELEHEKIKPVTYEDFSKEEYDKISGELNTIEQRLEAAGVKFNEKSNLKVKQKHPEHASVNISYTFSDVFTGAINAAMQRYTSDVSARMDFIKFTDINFVPWTNLKSAKTKMAYIQTLLMLELNDNPQLVYIINDPKSLEIIANDIDNTIRSAVNTKVVDTVHRIIPTSQVEEQDLRNIVMKRMLKGELGEEFNKIMEQIKALDSINTDMLKDMDEGIKARVIYFMQGASMRFNKSIKHTTIYRFLTAYLTQGQSAKSVTTQKYLTFFAQPKSIFEITRTLSKDRVNTMLKDPVKNKDYLEKVVQDVVQSDLYQKLLKRTNAVAVMEAHNTIAHDAAQEKHDNDAVDEATTLIQEREEYKQTVLQERDSVKESIEKTEKNIKENIGINKHPRKNIRVNSKLSRVKDKVKFLKNVNTNAFADFDGLEVNIYPTEYNIDETLSNFYVATKGYTAQGHGAVLKSMINNLIELRKQGHITKIGYYKNQYFVDCTNKKNLFEILYALYKNNSPIVVRISNKNDKNINTTNKGIIRTFRRQMWQRARYYIDTEAILKDYKEQDTETVLEEITKKAEEETERFDNFVKLQQENRNNGVITDEQMTANIHGFQRPYKAIVDKIYNDAYTRTHELLATSYITQGVRNIVEPLESFEVNYVKSVTKGTLIVAPNVLKQTTYSNKMFFDILDDIIELDDFITNPDKQTRTMWGEVLRNVHMGITEDYEHKQRVKYKYSIEWDATNKEYVFKYKDKTYNMYEILHMYGFNYMTFQHFAFKCYKGKDKVDHIPLIMNQYNDIAYKYGEILGISAFPNKETFINMYVSDTVSEKDLEQIYDTLTKNPNISNFIERLGLNTHNIKYFEKATGDKTWLEILFSKELLQIVSSAEKTLPKGQDLSAYIAYKLLNSNYEHKDLVLTNVFFPDVKVATGVATKAHIEQLNHALVAIKKKLDKTTNPYSRSKLEVKISIIEDKIKYYTEINKNISLDFLRSDNEKINIDDNDEVITHSVSIDYAKFYKYLSTMSIEQFTKIFNSTTKFSDTNKYTYAKYGDEYVLTTKDNVEEVGKGAPGLNDKIIEHVYKYEEITNSNKKTADKFKDDSGQTEAVLKDDAYIAGDNTQAILIISKSHDTDQIYQSYFKRKYKYVYILTQKQFDELKGMEHNVTNKHEYIIKDTVEDFKPLINITNVKGSKVTSKVFLEDVQKYNELQQPTDKIVDYYNTATKYALFPANILTGRSLTNTQTYKNMKELAIITKAHKEFASYFIQDGEYIIDLDIINLLFNKNLLGKNALGEYEDIDIERYLRNNHAEYYKLLIERRVHERLSEAIAHIRATYPDITFDAEKALSSDLLDNITRLTDIATEFVRKLKNNNRIIKRISEKFNDLHDKELYEESALLCEQSGYLYEIEKEYTDLDMFDDTIKWAKDIKANYNRSKVKNLKDLHRVHNGKRRERIQTPKEHVRFNYSSVYTMIRGCERARDSLLRGETLNFFGKKPPIYIQLINPYILNKELHKIKDALYTEFKTNPTIKIQGTTKSITTNTLEEYASIIIFENIIYPYIQNVGTKLSYTSAFDMYININSEISLAVKAQMDSSTGQNTLLYVVYNFQKFINDYTQEQLDLDTLKKRYQIGIDMCEQAGVLIDTKIEGFSKLNKLIITSKNPKVVVRVLQKVTTDISNYAQKITLTDEDIKALEKITADIMTVFDRKQINYTEDTDKNYYTYDTPSLRRDRYYLYKDGDDITNERPKDAKTIAQHYSELHPAGAEKNTTEYNVEKLVDTLVDNMRTAITSWAKVKEKNTETDEVEKILVENNIYNIDALWTFLYKDKKQHLKNVTEDTFKTVAQAIASFKMPKQYDYKDPGNVLDDLYKKCFDKKMSEDSEVEKNVEVFNTIAEIVSLNRALIYGVYHRYDTKPAEWKDAKEMWECTNTPILNNDKQFFQELKTFINKKHTNTEHLNRILGLYVQGGIDPAYNAFMEATSLYDFYTRYEPYISLHFEDKQDAFFAFIMLVNKFKLAYLKKIVSNAYSTDTPPVQNPKFWFCALRQTDDSQRATNYNQVKAASISHMYNNQSSVYRENVIQAIREPISSVNGMRSTIANTNNELKHVIVRDDKKYNTNTINNKYILFVPNNMETIKRKVHNYVVEPLFKDRNAQTMDQQLIASITRELDLGVYETYAEMEAESVNNVGTFSETYHSIRTLFTDVYKLLYKDFKNKDFVRIYQITTALRFLQTEDAGYYLKVFNNTYTYNKATADNPEEYEKNVSDAINSICKYFNDHSSFLTDINAERAKAVIGYIWYQRNKNKQDFETRIHDIQKFNLEKWYRTATVYGKKVNASINKIQSIVNSNELPKNKKEKLAKLIYNKSYNKLEDDIKNNLNDLISLSIPTLSLPTTHLWDTLTVARANDFDTFEDYVANSTILRYTSEQIRDLQKKEISLKTQISRYKNTKEDNTGINTLGLGNISRMSIDERYNAIYEKQQEIDAEIKRVEADHYVDVAFSMRYHLENTSIYVDYLNYLGEKFKENLDAYELELTKFLDQLKKRYPKAYTKLISNLENYYDTYVVYFASKEANVFKTIRSTYDIDNIKNYTEIHKYILQELNLNLSNKEIDEFIQTHAKKHEEANKTRNIDKIYQDPDDPELTVIRKTTQNNTNLQNIVNQYIEIRNKINLKQDTLEKNKELVNRYSNLPEDATKRRELLDEIDEKQLYKVFMHYVHTIKKDTWNDVKKVLEESKSKTSHVAYKPNAEGTKKIEEIYIDAIQEFWENQIDMEEAPDFVIQGFVSIKNNEEYNKLKHDKELTEKLISSYNSVYHAQGKIGDCEKELEIVQNKIRDLTEELNKYKNDYKRSKELYEESHGKGTRTNSAIYRMYNNIPNATNKELVNHVKDRIIREGLMTEEELNKLVKDDELHNSIIDCFVTMFNYIEQRKNVNVFEENFIIMDMETVKDYTDENTPYQLTIIKGTMENGKPKVQVYNAFYNNAVFYDTKPDSTRGEYLEKFYKQQRSIWEESDEDLQQITDPIERDKYIDARFNELLKKVKGQKNTLNLTKTFIQLLQSTKGRIVAHNGDAFDFANYDKFITAYSARLIKNEYYNMLTKNTPSEILKRLESENIEDANVSDQYLEQLQNEISRLEANKPITRAEANNIGNALERLYEELLRVRVTRMFQESMMAQGKYLDNSIVNKLYNNDNSDFNRIIDALYEHFVKDLDEEFTINDIYSILQEIFPDATDNELQILKEYTKELIANTKKTYEEYIYNNKIYEAQEGTKASVIKNATEHILEGFTNKETYSMTQRMQSLNLAIQTLRNAIDVVHNNETDFKEYIKNENKKIKHYEELHKSLMEKAKKLEDKLQQHETDINKNYKELIEYAQDIRSTINTRFQEARRAINNNLEQAVKKIQHKVDYDTDYLQISIENLYKDIENDIKVLDNIIEYITSNGNPTKLLEEIMSTEILSIKDEISKTNAIEVLNKDLSIINDILNKLKTTDGDKSFVENIRKNLKEEQTNLYNTIEDLLTNTKFINDFKIHINNKDREAILSELKQIFIGDNRNNMYLRKVVDLCSTKGILYKNEELIKAFEEQKVYDILTQIKSLLTNYYTIQQTYKVRAKHYAELIEFSKNKPEYSAKTVEQVKAVVESILDKLYQTDELKNQKINEIQAQALFKKSKISFLPDKKDPDYQKQLEDRINYASETYEEDSEQALAMKEYGINVVYKNTSANNDIYGFVLDPKYIWRAVNVDTEYKSFSTYDDITDSLQTIVVPPTAKTLDDCKINITYTYNIKGLDLHKPRRITKSYTINEFKYMMEKRNFFDKDKGISKGLNAKDILYPTGKDTCYEAVCRLYDYIKGCKLLKDLEAKDNIVDKYKIGLDKLKLVNLSERCMNQFMYWTDVISAAKQGEYEYINSTQIYTGIYNRLIGKYNAVEPGKILNLIPQDYAYDYMYDFTPEDLVKLNINPAEASEGSMGLSFTFNTVYSTAPQFSLNTNSVRSVLSSGVIKAKFTPIGSINELYKRKKDKGKVTNITDYLYDPTSDEFKEYIEKDIEKDLQSFKFEGLDEDTIKSIKDEYIENEIKFRTNKEKFMNEQFRPHKINDEYRDESLPTVGDFDYLDKHLKDVNHRTGVNAKIAFINLPAAFEDVILIDYEYATYMEWMEGNKTWAGPGFKGGVRYVKDLHKNYGAYFAASASSVIARGAYGVNMEMMANAVLDHVLGHEKIKGLTDEQYEKLKEIKIYNDAKDVDTTDPLYVIKGRMYTQKDVDYDKVFTDIFGSNYLRILSRKPNIDKLQLYTASDDTIHDVDITNLEYTVGTMYIRMDAEHFAEHMQVKPLVQAQDDGTLAYVAKDSKGSVQKGGIISYTIDQILMQKVGPNWREVFLLDDTTQKLRETQTFIFVNGFEKFETVTTNGLIDIEKTITKLQETYTFDESTLKDLRLYFNVKNRTDDEIKTYTLERLQIKAKDNALQSLKSNHGTIYRSEYARHDAVRAQMLANIDLKIGTIKLPQNELEQLLLTSSTKGWAKHYKETNTYNTRPQGTLQERLALVEELVGNGYYNKIWIDNKEHVNYELIGAQYKRIQGIKRLVYVKEIKFNTDFYRTEAYVMAIRTPVQDYNATPIVKVVGACNHAAVECNAYIYKMMGGDNDGDTAVFLPVDYNAVRNNDGSINTDSIGDLDSTETTYYDEGYIRKRETDDMKYEDNSLINALDGYVSGDMRYAFIGKNTVPKGVRGRTAHYTYYELYIAADKDIFKDINTEGIKLNNLVEEDKKDPENTYKFWVNVHIRLNNKGANYTDTFTDYKDSKAYYEKHKNDIDRIRKIEKYVQTHKLKEYLPAKYNEVDFILRVRDIATCNTLMRGRASKLGVAYMGGQRKNQNLGTTVSTFTKMNRDATGKIWYDVYGIGWDEEKNKYKYITVEDLIKAIVNTTNMDVVYTTSLNKMKTTEGKYRDKDEAIKAIAKWINDITKDTFNNHTKEKCINDYDLDKIIKFIAETLYNYHRVVIEYDTIRKLCLSDNITYKDVLDHFTTCAAKDNKWVTEFIQACKKQDANQIIDKPVQEMIIAYYFGRFRSAFIRSTLKAEQYAEQYIKQIIVTRPVSNDINNMAQEPISLSKHGGIGMDMAELHKRYMLKINKFTKERAIRQINISGNVEHDRSFAMAMDYDAFDKQSITSTESETLGEARTKYATAQNSAKNRISYKNKEALQNSVNEYIDYIMNNELTNLPTQAAYENIKAHLISIQTILKEYKNSFKAIANNQDTIDKLYEHILWMQVYNIPYYRVMNGIIDSLTTLVNVNKTWRQYHPNQLGIYKSAIDVLANCKSMWQLNFTIYNNRKQFEANLNELYKRNNPKLKNILDWFLGKDEMNPDLLLLDGNLEIQTSANMKDLTTMIRHKGSSLDELQTIINNERVDNNPPAPYIKTEPVSERLNDELYANLNFIGSQERLSLEESMDLKLEEVYRKIDIIERQQKFLKEQIGIRNRIITEQDELDNLLRSYGFGAHILRPHILKASGVLQDIQDLKTHVSNLRKEINTIKYKANSLKLEIDNLKQIKNYNTKNKTLEDKLQKDLEERLEDLRKLQRSAISFALSEHVGGMISVLRNGEGQSMQQGKISKPSMLSIEDIQQFQDSLLMNMDSYQTPFINITQIFIKDGDIDWDEFYKMYKDNHKYYRLTVVMKPFDDEGLIKNLNDYFTKEIKDFDKLSKREQRKILREQAHKFKTIDDLKEFIKTISKDNKIRLQNQTYSEALFTQQELDDPNNIINNFITPTLKEVVVHSGKDLKAIFELLKNSNYQIGFTSLNDIMTSMSSAYKPFKFSGTFSQMIAMLNIAQKTLMRMSAGFLLRNAVDTFNQLTTELYQQQNGYGAILKSPEIIYYLGKSKDIYDLYRYISQDRLVFLIEVQKDFDDIETCIKTNNTTELYKKIDRIQNHINTYISYSKQLTDIDRVQLRTEYAIKINDEIELLKSVLNKNPNAYKLILNGNTMQRAVKFLMNIRFAEYFKMYDGLRVDQNSKASTRVKRIIENQDDLASFEAMLFEISAFMQTNAQVDMFKQMQYDELSSIVAMQKDNMLSTDTEEEIVEIQKYIEQERANYTNEVGVWISNHIPKLYSKITEDTENLARIIGFIYNRNINNRTFDESINLSLRSWFNYGQQSPLEKQLTFDIPYIAFPIRSIDNWIERILNPRFAVLMDDIIDGIYGQYADEDGQYSEWEEFMIKSGWIPITNKLGIRAGSGVFDIQNLLTDTADNIEQRRNPLLKGLVEFIQSGDLKKATSNLATTSAINRAVNTFGVKQGATQKTLGNSSTMFFEYNDDYEKYTPYKYRNNNGRWIYYENIYKDWFNKYGRMRRPTQDPVQLVKNIQWKQYLRYKQNLKK